MLNAGKLIDEAAVYLHNWRHPSAPEHDDAGTKWTNRFSEATKASYYFAAHIDQIVWPGFILLAAIEIGRAVLHHLASH